jgi:GntR family transcriptional repressor for pyruvate dehydrogenase complex
LTNKLDFDLLSLSTGSTNHPVRLNMQILTKDFKPVPRSKLFQEIVRQILDLINKGRLKEGEQLPAERELAELFKVSRNSLREAIRTLEEKGMLVSRPGDGTYVIIKNTTSIVEPLARAIQREKADLADIFEFRRVIEPTIAALAAENASPHEIDELATILECHRQSIDDVKAVKELDCRFHLALARASGNNILFRIVESVNTILEETRQEFLQTQNYRTVSLRGHFVILKAVRKRQSQTARKAMLEHLRTVEDAINITGGLSNKLKAQKKKSIPNIL